MSRSVGPGNTPTVSVMATTTGESVAPLTCPAELAPVVTDVSLPVSNGQEAPRRPSGLLASPPAVAGLLARARTHGVTGPATVAIEALLLALGVAIDLPGQPAVGAGVAVTVLVAAAAGAALIRYRSLLTAVALPPLLLLGAAVALARLGGQDRGSRELVLDVGTTLALSAPLAFGATALAIVIALVRVVRHVASRRR